MSLIHPDQFELNVVRAELDQLRAQLAEAQAENERLKAEYAEDVGKLLRSTKYIAGIAERGLGTPQPDSVAVEDFVLGYVKQLEQRIAATRTALAAAQVREEKLREGISVICGPVMCSYTERQQWEDYQELIAQPRDDSALREMIAGVYEECAKIPQSIAESLATTYGYDDMGGLSFGKGDHAEEKMGRYNELLEISDAIRALAKQKGCM